MRRNVLVCIMVLAVAVAFMPVGAFAETQTARMTSYTVCKDGNTVYCAGESGIYKVRFSKGKVKSKKRLVKSAEYNHIYTLAKKGEYVYFQNWTKGTMSSIKRVKTSGGKAKTLVTVNELYNFAISGKKIYYSYCDYDSNYNEVTHCMVMNLNGKGKKSTTIQAESTQKTSNAKGYRVNTKKQGKYAKDYLKTPKGTVYLGKSKKYYW